MLAAPLPCSMPSLSPLTEQQRHVLHQHEQQLQQLQQLLTSQPLNPVSVPDGLLKGKALELGWEASLPPAAEPPLRSCAFSPSWCRCGRSEEESCRQEGVEGADRGVGFVVRREKCNLGFPHPEGARAQRS